MLTTSLKPRLQLSPAGMPEGQEPTTPTAGTKVGRRGGKPGPFGSFKDFGWWDDRDIAATVSFLARSCSVGGLGDGVGMSLQVQPPCGFGRTPPVHCHRDQVAPVLDVADDDLSRQPGASARRGEPQRPRAVRLWPPQTQSAARRPHQRAMPVPEQHDEPPRRQPGPAATRSGCPYLTNPRHNQSVKCRVTPKQGPKAITYQAIDQEPDPRSCAHDSPVDRAPRASRTTEPDHRKQAGDAWQDNELMYPSWVGTPVDVPNVGRA